MPSRRPRIPAVDATDVSENWRLLEREYEKLRNLMMDGEVDNARRRDAVHQLGVAISGFRLLVDRLVASLVTPNPERN